MDRDYKSQWRGASRNGRNRYSYSTGPCWIFRVGTTGTNDSCKWFRSGWSKHGCFVSSGPSSVSPRRWCGAGGRRRLGRRMLCKTDPRTNLFQPACPAGRRLPLGSLLQPKHGRDRLFRCEYARHSQWKLHVGISLLEQCPGRLANRRGKRHIQHVRFFSPLRVSSDGWFRGSRWLWHIGN